ncbi:MAG: helix-turn-helix domain-containing protein [Acidimicrobiales bacterium]
MLRIHFTVADMANVRISSSWGPLTETLFSLQVLEEARPGLVVEGWRQATIERIGRIGETVQSLMTQVQLFAHVDLHTLAGPTESIEEAADALLGAPRAHLTAEIEPLASQLAGVTPRTRSWLRDLHRGDPRALRHLIAGLRAYNETAVDPHWDAIRSHLDVDRAYRARIMSEGGLERLLGTLDPRIRWRAPVLEIRERTQQRRLEPRRHHDVHLGGRSMVLVPSVFCRDPMVFSSEADVTAPAVLFYPALREPEDAMAIWAGSAPRGYRLALDSLLGRTRATALAVVADTCTTNELARRIGVSASTASHHASVLRDAGLISTHRNGSAVLHSITLRGAMLLDGPRRLAERRRADTG